MHEERTVTAGLKSFSPDAHADHISVSVKGDEVTVRLWFNG